MAGVLALTVAALGTGVPQAASAAPAGTTTPTTAAAWSLQRALVSPTSSGALSGVACPGASDCVAVGSDGGGKGEVGLLAEVWDGTRWRRAPIPLPAGASNPVLNAVSCATATECTAVGYDQVSSDYAGLIEKWDGATWHVAPTPAPGVPDVFLNGVSCPTAEDCTAVGQDDAGAFAEQWSGHSWTIEAVPPPRGGSNADLTAVSCTAASSCTAVGSDDLDGSGNPEQSLIEVWDGTAWAQQAAPTVPKALGDQLAGVSCLSPVDCMAAGSSYHRAGETVEYVPLAEHWDGTTWSVLGVPDPSGEADSELDAVSCSAPAACTAVGYSLAPSSFHPTSLAERWDGTVWSIEAAPPQPTTASLASVQCTSGTYCMATGTQTLASGLSATLAEVWDGTTWVAHTPPSPGGANGFPLQAVSCTSSDRCMAVGTAPYSGAPWAESWDGYRWRPSYPVTPAGDGQANLLGVACTAPTSCTAVGLVQVAGVNEEETVAEHWDGTSWAVEATPSSTGAPIDQLQAISCTSASDCTAVGYDDDTPNGFQTLAEHWDGMTWTVQPTGAAGVLDGVSCAAAGECVATGGGTTGGLVSEVLTAGAWHAEPVPAPVSATREGPLTAVSCTAPTACTAVGTYAVDGTTSTLAETWDGTSWSLAPSVDGPGSTDSALLGVSCAVSTGCQAVGYYEGGSGTLLPLAETVASSSSEVEPTPIRPFATSALLYGVSCVPSGTCEAVGRLGTSERGQLLPTAEVYSS